MAEASDTRVDKICHLKCYFHEKIETCKETKYTTHTGLRKAAKKKCPLKGPHFGLSRKRFKIICYK